MVEFRKWFPALALIALMFGSAVLASAQQGMTCTTTTSVPPVVRAEGIAELLGDIVLTCQNGAPTAVGGTVPGVNVSVFLNTNVTSRVLTSDGLTEALLMIDEPAAGQQVPCSSTLTAGGSCPIVVSSANTSATGINYRGGAVPNVFQGRLVSSGAQNYLFWSGVPIDAPGTTTAGASRTIRITNLRGDASQLGGSTFIGAAGNPIVAFVSVNSTQAISIQNPQPQVGLPIKGLADFKVLAGGTGSNALTPFLQCQGLTVSATPAFRARFTEGFSSAFRPRNANPGTTPAAPGGLQGLTFPAGYDASATFTPVAQASPGQVLFTESGFYNPALATGAAGSLGNTASYANAGLATNGTRFIIRFTNIPNGVSVYGGLTEYATCVAGSTTAACQTPTTASRVIAICGANANGTGGQPCTSSTVNDVPGLTALTSSNGAGALVYEVVTSDPFTVESFDIPLYVSFPANQASLTPSNALPAVTGALAPLSNVHTASSTEPVPRFVDQAISQNTFLINPCRTNLLFPFVTNQFGFDTGIAISNTSQDPFSTTTQSGPCTINYYGSTLGGGAAPAAQRTTAPVAAGSTFTFTLGLGSASEFGLTGATAFSGYIIATCDFQYAHGFAFITDGPIGTARVAEGYLALVMDAPVGSRTSYQSESLNQ